MYISREICDYETACQLFWIISDQNLDRLRHVGQQIVFFLPSVVIISSTVLEKNMKNQGKSYIVCFEYFWW